MLPNCAAPAATYRMTRDELTRDGHTLFTTYDSFDALNFPTRVTAPGNVRTDFHRLLRLWQQGQLDLERMITRRIDLSEINDADEKKLYDQLVDVAKRRTADADVKLDKHGRPIEEEELELGENVLIVDPSEQEEELLALVAGNGDDDTE